MSLTRQQKEQRVAEVGAELTKAMSVVFMSYDGMTVDEAEELRDALFAEKSTMRVVPKRLLRLALQQAKIDFDPTQVEGQVAIISGQDAVAPAKVLYTFAKAHQAIKMLAGSLEGKVLSFEEVQSLAQLPSRQELLAKFVYVLAGPVRGLQTVLTGAQRDLVYALKAIAEEKQEAA